MFLKILKFLLLLLTLNFFSLKFTTYFTSSESLLNRIEKADPFVKKTKSKFEPTKSGNKMQIDEFSHSWALVTKLMTVCALSRKLQGTYLSQYPWTSYPQCHCAPQFTVHLTKKTTWRQFSKYLQPLHCQNLFLFIKPIILQMKARG